MVKWPMAQETIIRCDLDFEAEGKQVGYLGVPKSTNDSAYGTVTIPITVIKHSDGPTMSFTGGVHGDEYEGPVALMKLARMLRPEEIRGRVIIIPCLNIPAVLAGLRCSPIDGLNLNRVFPGRHDGSLTETIAHYITSELVPLSDVHLDLHSGGTTLEYLPTIFVDRLENQAAEKRKFEAAMAFGAEITVLFDDYPDTGRFLTSAFMQAGVQSFSVELGGAAKVSPTIVNLAEHGVRNLLKHYGILSGDPVSPEDQGRSPTRLANVKNARCYVIAPDDGIYEPFIDLGDSISRDQVIGQVHYPQHHDRKPLAVKAPESGFLLCKRPLGNVHRGDNIAIIAQPAGDAG